MQLFSVCENEYDNKIAPFTRNGVLIDTSTLWEFVQGLIRMRRGTTNTKGWQEEYGKIVNLLERIKLTNNWHKIYLTPHIMTETCSHFNLQYNAARDRDFSEIGRQIIEIIDATTDQVPKNKECTSCYQLGTPLEPGDLSIYAIADNFAKNKKKIAILTKDGGFTTRYATNPYVMVIDHNLVVEGI